MKIDRITVVGIPVDNVREEDIKDAACYLTDDKTALRQIVFLSLWDLMRARRDKEYRSCVEQALVIPVSKGILKGAKFQKKKVPARHMPFDFMIQFFSALEAQGYSLYLLGCRPAELRNIEHNLKQTFPDLKIVGRYTGYYQKSKDDDISTAIKKASPHCVLIGSGIRGKEKWISRHRNIFSSGVFIYSPLVMDIISGKRTAVSRETFSRGLEFVPDLIRHPFRILRCIVYMYYTFLLLIYRLRNK